MQAETQHTSRTKRNKKTRETATTPTPRISITVNEHRISLVKQQNGRTADIVPSSFQPCQPAQVTFQVFSVTQFCYHMWSVSVMFFLQDIFVLSILFQINFTLFQFYLRYKIATIINPIFVHKHIGSKKPKSYSVCIYYKHNLSNQIERCTANLLTIWY